MPTAITSPTTNAVAEPRVSSLLSSLSVSLYCVVPI